jgi:hypothetical protein
MAVFEQKTPWKTRKDVQVDDIAPNVRYVHLGGFHAVTLTLSTDEAFEFAQWCKVQKISIRSTINQVKQGITQLVMPMLTENQVMLIKLTWSRYDLVD